MWIRDEFPVRRFSLAVTGIFREERAGDGIGTVQRRRTLSPFVLSTCLVADPTSKSYFGLRFFPRDGWQARGGRAIETFLGSGLRRVPVSA